MAEQTAAADRPKHLRKVQFNNIQPEPGEDKKQKEVKYMKVLKKFASIIIAGMFDDSGVEYGGILRRMAY